MTGELQVSRLRHPMSAATGELPRWYVENEWYRRVRVVLAPGHRPGAPRGAEPGCGPPDRRCLRIVGPDGAVLRGSLAAVALTAGPTLDGLDGSTGGLPELFEAGNAVPGALDLVFTARSATFNDQAAGVAP